MNFKDMVRRKVEINSLVMYGTKNAVKCSHYGKRKGYPSEGAVHRRFKWLVSDFCYENNLQFFTEAVFKGKRGRCDTLILDWGLGVEILVSESQKDFSKKDYPLSVIAFDVNNGEESLNGMLCELRDTLGSAKDFYVNKYGGKLID